MKALVPRAVFLDRDGVLIADTGLITKVEDVHILDNVPEALWRLRTTGFRLIVISNQAVVARGLMSEEEVAKLQEEIGHLLVDAGAPPLDGFFFCPHHPRATVMSYRMVCECRKPRPGLLLRAAHEIGIDLLQSFMVGDRITDVIAGTRAGCRTVLLETGAHRAAAIETDEPIDFSAVPDYRCASLIEAASWIARSL